METFETVLEAGADRTLHVDIPVAGSGRRYRVVVILNEDESRPACSNFPAEWPALFFEKTAGAWQGDFDRPDQGKLEQREEF